MQEARVKKDETLQLASPVSSRERQLGNLFREHENWGTVHQAMDIVSVMLVIINRYSGWDVES